MRETQYLRIAKCFFHILLSVSKLWERLGRKQDFVCLFLTAYVSFKRKLFSLCLRRPLWFARASIGDWPGFTFFVWSFCEFFNEHYLRKYVQNFVVSMAIYFVGSSLFLNLLTRDYTFQQCELLRHLLKHLLQSAQ